MKNIILSLMLILPALCFAQDDIEVDINCDGKKDLASINQDLKNVTLSVKLHDGIFTNELSFSLNEPQRQDGLCGDKAYLNVESLEKDLSMMLGENPEGYKPIALCKGLNISGGECDSIHIFFNHNTKQINWWRL